MRDLVLAGGGHSHVAVLKSFGARPASGARLTLISRDRLTAYSGMLPGFLAGHYGQAESHIDLAPLSRFAGARFVQANVTGVDAARRLIRCEGLEPVRFDLLSLDIGAAPGLAAIAGAELALPIKPIDGFLRGWAAIERRVLERGGSFRLLIVGGGAGGVELCLSLRYRLHRLLAERGGDAGRLSFAIVTDTAEPLPQHAPAVRARIARLLAERGIPLHAGFTVEAFDAGTAHCRPPHDIAFDAAILATGAAAPSWLGQTGLALDGRGFVRVDAALRSPSHAFVFAAGDIAAIDGHALPKSGVYAVRQGPVLAANLRAALAGRPLSLYRPQCRTLALISTGDRRALASYGCLAWQGAWVWRAKDWLDRRWLRRYQLPPA